MVNTGISIDEHTFIHVIRNGTVVDTRMRSSGSLLSPNGAEIGDDFTLMDDNCSPHIANLLNDFIFEKGILQMEWPATLTPAMNLIDHVWDILRRLVASHSYHSYKLSKSWKGLFCRNGIKKTSFSLKASLTPCLKDVEHF
ncbi:transposable element Tcb2 transposase [Trichonephila clavipes]|nr:transposable element Tcb2 transposase [Trichonephila clavipes]